MLLRPILVPRFAPLVALGALAACSSSSSSAPTTATPSDAGADVAATITEHGTIVDYLTMKPVAGLTVSDNGVTATTDDKGNWSLAIPATATLLQPTITGTKYTQLLFPDVKPAGADVNHGTSVMPDAQAFSIEQSSLDAFDATKAVVQIVVQANGTCASAVGGTLTVTSPPGAKLVYFSGAGFPDATVTSIQDVTQPRSVAVVYDITPGADLVVALSHPTCKPAAFPFVVHGVSFTGTVRTVAAEPGDVNAALVLALQ